MRRSYNKRVRHLAAVKSWVTRRKNKGASRTKVISGPGLTKWAVSPLKTPMKTGEVRLFKRTKSRAKGNAYDVTRSFVSLPAGSKQGPRKPPRFGGMSLAALRKAWSRRGR